MTSTRTFGPIQLATWLGLSPKELQRAWALGLIPAPDVNAERWSEQLAKTLPDRLDHIRATLDQHSNRPTPAPPPVAGKPAPKATKGKTRSFGPIQLAKFLGLENWQVGRGVQKGLIPPPDIDDQRWSEQLAKTLPDHTDHIRATLGDHPGHGSVQAAKVLTQRTNLDVTRDDVLTLHQQGTLTPVGEFRGWPMFAEADLRALDPQTVAAAVQARLDWLHASLTSPEAAKALGWPQGRFEVTAERQGIRPGKFDRYALTDVQALQPRPDDTDPT
ncbi:hypothetical protein SUDANB67_05605 (plasmid) [Nocardiopsis dassonvillei]|uniref:hypothetical protein n=1 Tax=Nocardiopsis dassonvillei TaxID=2014 RepID=UPI003F56CBC6